MSSLVRIRLSPPFKGRPQGRPFLINKHSLDSHLTFDESDQLLGYRNAAVDDVCGIPVILVKDDLTFAVETHVRNTDRLLPSACRSLFEV